MKKHILICTFAIAACAGNVDQKDESSKTIEENTLTETTLPTTAQNRRYCFLRTEGTDNQDTTTVQFSFNEDNVAGEMNWIPKEKDSRKGVLTGTILGDEIKAVWSYMQEGMKDSMTVAFKLSPQQLAQKPLKVDTVTGRQETDERADYTVIYMPHNCDQLTPSLMPSPPTP